MWLRRHAVGLQYAAILGGMVAVAGCIAGLSLGRPMGIPLLVALSSVWTMLIVAEVLEAIARMLDDVAAIRENTRQNALLAAEWAQRDKAKTHDVVPIPDRPRRVIPRPPLPESDGVERDWSGNPL